MKWNIFKMSEESVKERISKMTDAERKEVIRSGKCLCGGFIEKRNLYQTPLSSTTLPGVMIYEQTCMSCGNVYDDNK